ncbi:MAG TPA: DUF2505 family protein, partial [Acidimicrobiales bacterium]|nr:DUF2505 family protein [Acidimicrobiales bacterium]
VEDVFVDPAFLASLGRLPNLGGAELLDQRVDGHLVHQQVRYAFTGELSSAVTRVVDPRKLTWIESSTLDRRTHATDFEILPDHYANRLSARGRFTLTGATRRTADADLTVHIPLVGRRAEQAIVSGLTEHARLEADAVNDWLRDQQTFPAEQG